MTENTDLLPFAATADYAERPLWLAESAWLGHGPFAFWLMARHRPRLVVELGVHRGYSLGVFAQAMRRLRPDGHVVGVDTWIGDEHAGFYGEEIFQELRAHTEAEYGPLVELKRKLFSQALDEIPDGSVDLLHIDGRHHYADVVEDYRSWIPKLSDRAIVLFHDTQVRERNFGVWRLWSEIASTRPSFEFHHCHGLGVFAHGTAALHEDIAALMSPVLEETAGAAVRNRFAAQGAIVTRIVERRARRRRRLRRMTRLVTRLPHHVEVLMERLAQVFAPAKSNCVGHNPPAE